jgi:hypothetical protein
MILWMHNRIPPAQGPQIPGPSMIIIDRTLTFTAEFFELSAKTLEFDTKIDGGFSLSYIVR